MRKSNASSDLTDNSLVRIREEDGEPEYHFSILPPQALRAYCRLMPTQPVPDEGLWANSKYRVFASAEDGRLRFAISIMIRHDPGISPKHLRIFCVNAFGLDMATQKDGRTFFVAMPSVRSFKSLLADLRKNGVPS